MEGNETFIKLVEVNSEIEKLTKLRDQANLHIERLQRIRVEMKKQLSKSKN